MKSIALLPSILFLADPAASLSASSGFFKLDRFTATCPTDESCIRQFDFNLMDADGNGIWANIGTWAAVYRSNNNKPSLFARDEFFSAMSEATTPNYNDNSANQSSPDQVDSSKISTPMALEKPVAVARLIPSPDFEHKWILDCMRCALKKEDLDETCDGGSEYVEALSVCVDSLLLHHLKENTKTGTVFEGSIRTKATLHSSKILEERGFTPVQKLSTDMATHISHYDDCLKNYALRTASTNLSPEARDRALQIVSLLGKLDEELERKAKENDSADGNSDEDDDYDPWANISMQI
ncbi:unnamed protein product [Cylindrotheca closterium]|uniref:Uncharacterized protein n=1 Tax=Cylindrotheca closterium TaxID=2856 RepID=A0AAD2FG73_9STRA|nr:unnamed protein product [Cylindrotheca closterium]